MAKRVLIVGGGLAGLAAAVALAPRGYQVTVLEARNRLGGRAGSFQDPSTGEMIDACQHVTMGCCTNFAHFCRTLGIDRLLEPQPTLYFMTPDRRVSQFRGEPWPAPLHLARSFMGAHFLTPLEKLRVAWGLAWLKLASDKNDPPFRDWLDRHGQTPRTIERFWGVVLVSALNESPDRVGLRYARKVFVDGFLSHPRGFEVSVPVVPLGRLYGDETLAWLQGHGVELRLLQGVKRMIVENGAVAGLETRHGERLEADYYVAAVPFDRLLDMMGEKNPFDALKCLQASPITSVHFWFDRKVMDLPHVVLVDCLGQWVFNRGQNASEEHYVQVVISASRQLKGLGREETQRQILAELRRLFPRAAAAEVRRAKVVTEHAATFSAVPGVDRWRPEQATSLPNLFLAGDWTATGWPATMEGAVRAGYLAVEGLLKREGRAEMILRRDLGD